MSPYSHEVTCLSVCFSIGVDTWYTMRCNKATISGALLIGLCIFAVLLCGCTGNTGETTSTESTNVNPIKAAQEESGVLTITGSTTVLPVAAQAAELYMDNHPGVDVQVTGGGSGVGVQSAGEGTAMIGMASRDLKKEETEKYPELQEHQIAIDGIAIITHKTNPISSLTLDQVKAIYNGNVTNWKDVGGSDAEIIVIGRDSASGTREFFHEKIMNKEDFAQTQLEKNSNGAVRQSVEQTPAAIGYVGLGYIDENIHAVPILVDGKAIVPSIESVEDGSYPVARPLNLLTNGEPEGIISEFIGFISSPEGQKIVTEEGFVPITR